MKCAHTKQGMTNNNIHSETDKQRSLIDFEICPIESNNPWSYPCNITEPPEDSCGLVIYRDRTGRSVSNQTAVIHPPRKLNRKVPARGDTSFQSTTHLEICDLVLIFFKHLIKDSDACTSHGN